jgi:DNA replication and repair protein RecF
MTLRRMQVTDFRCLHQADIELDPHFTLISGPNASGKTSLLEAIYVLGRGRSFRTRRLHHLIRSGCERFIVFGEVELPERRVAMGIEGSATGIRARLSGEKAASLAELATVFPVQIIDPEVHRLIEEGPNRRRRFLDWGVFHVEPGFVTHWQQYHHVLKQRNAALRARQPPAVISAWDGELARFGDLLTQARSRYVAQLAAQAGVLAETLLGMKLTLTYRTGWARDSSLAEALELCFAQDQESGVTSVGPHRADLAIRLDGFAVKDRISRGQQKLLAAALLIAQLKLFPEDSPVRPTLLLDDPAAELDGERLAGLIQEVRAQSLQLVVSTLHAEFCAFGTPGHKLRLDGGVVTATG